MADTAISAADVAIDEVLTATKTEETALIKLKIIFNLWSVVNNTGDLGLVGSMLTGCHGSVAIPSISGVYSVLRSETGTR